MKRIISVSEGCVERETGRLTAIVLCSLALSVYLFVIYEVGTIPYSDFALYHETALDITKGKGVSDQYRYFQPAGYPYLLAAVFLVSSDDSILVPQFLNAFLLIVILWIFLRYPFISSTWGVFFGYLIMGFNVNYLAMVSVLCSEIPYVFCLFIGLFLLWRGFQRVQGAKGSRPQLFFFLSSGLCLGLSQFIRPLTFAYLIVFSVVMMTGYRYFSFEPRRMGWMAAFWVSLRTLGFVWLSFFAAATTLYWISGYGVTCMPLQKGLWNLHIGFNLESKGGYDVKDGQIIGSLGSKYGWDAGKVNGDFRPIVFGRIRENWAKNLEILPQKLSSLLSPAVCWSIEKSQVKNKERVYRIASYLSWMNASVLTVSFAAWISWLTRRKISKEEFIPFCLIGAAFLYIILHGYLLEVQGRYSNHLWMILFWCFPVCSWSMKQNLLKNLSWKLRKRETASFILTGAGILILLISVLADDLGIGGYPGFGKRQLIGAASGLVSVLIGIRINRKCFRHPQQGD